MKAHPRRKPAVKATRRPGVDAPQVVMAAILQGELTVAEIAKFTGLTPAAVRGALEQLVIQKQIVRAGSLYVPFDRIADARIQSSVA